MRLKEFFHNNENDSDDNTTDTEHDYRHSDFRKPSAFTPQARREPALDLYLKTLKRTILKGKPRPCKFNLSKAEREAIIALRKNKNIVIFEADKYGPVVVMNKDDYISEAQKQLKSVDAGNNRVYSELNFDCTQNW